MNPERVFHLVLATTGVFSAVLFFATRDPVPGWVAWIAIVFAHVVKTCAKNRDF